jgi:formate hydrogenlyase transcriptional activator
MNKQIERIPDEVMEALIGQSWPGNVRELQNFIERSVILTDGNTLRIPLQGLGQTAVIDSPQPITLKEAERHHIRKTLEQANWVVAGPTGAAVRLGNEAGYSLLAHAKAGNFQGESSRQKHDFDCARLR